MAAAHGLKSISLPTDLEVVFLSATHSVQLTLSSIVAPLEDSPTSFVCCRELRSRVEPVGCSVIQIAPHAIPNRIFIIPVRFLLSCELG